jgi:hypothetical protein
MAVVDSIASIPLGGQGPFPPRATPASPVIVKKVIVIEQPPPNAPSSAR